MIIGGDGSLTGARIFAQEFDVPCIGLPGTIDNDLYGTDTTIGYDTALNTILDAVDKIRDTATSHERLFFVEVMGRDAGFLALNGAIASGAEAAIIPEFSTEVDQLEEFIKNGFRKSKNSSIVLVAESELTGGAMHYAERVKNEYPQYDVRVTILGHLQRGGSPTAHDRILASRLGAAAIDAIMEDQRNVMIGIEHDEIVYVPFSKAIKNDKPVKRSGQCIERAFYLIETANRTEAYFYKGNIKNGGRIELFNCSPFLFQFIHSMIHATDSGQSARLVLLYPNEK